MSHGVVDYSFLFCPNKGCQQGSCSTHNVVKGVSLVSSFLLNLKKCSFIGMHVNADADILAND